MFYVTISIRQDGLHSYQHPDIKLEFRSECSEDMMRNIKAAMNLASVPSREDDDFRSSYRSPAEDPDA